MIFFQKFSAVQKSYWCVLHSFLAIKLYPIIKYYCKKLCVYMVFNVLVQLSGVHIEDIYNRWYVVVWYHNS